MKILAMDLSLNLPAFVLLEVLEKEVRVIDVCYVDNSKLEKRPQGYKLAEISKALENFIIKNEIYKDSSIHLVREKGFARYVAVTQSLYKVVGVTECVLYRMLNRVNISEISPTSVKKYITGNGKATKEFVMDKVRNYLIDEQKDMEFYSDDVSDAIAVGVSYALQKKTINEIRVRK